MQSMEPNLIFSIGSFLGFISMFYTWHKDSKSSTAKMARLSVRVENLEAKAAQTDVVLQELLSSVQEIKVALAKIDTKLSGLEQEMQYNKNKSS